MNNDNDMQVAILPCLLVISFVDDFKSQIQIVDILQHL